jgi:hypothetical protein
MLVSVTVPNGTIPIYDRLTSMSSAPSEQQSPTSSPSDFVQLDLLGEMHVDFEHDHFTFVCQGYSRHRFPSRAARRRVVVNTPIPYSEIEWIGCVRRRQWYLLIPGLFFTAFGPIWMTGCLGDWGPFTVSVAWFVLFGVAPIMFVVRGRPFLGIATRDTITIYPMDRQRKQVARILGLLHQAYAPPNAKWDLAGAPFDLIGSLDIRPPTGKRFDQNRYLRISGLIGAYGFANLLASIPACRNIGIAAILCVLTIALFWAIKALCRSRHR